jgi:hypothetical protein
MFPVLITLSLLFERAKVYAQISIYSAGLGRLVEPHGSIAGLLG